MEGKTGTDSASTTTTLLQIATTRPNGSVVDHIVGGTIEALALSGNGDLEAGKGSKKPKTPFFLKKKHKFELFQELHKKKKVYTDSILCIAFYTPFL